MITANITCPSGSSYFACADSSKFVGCCREGSSPCAATGCAAGDLFAASIQADQHGKVGDQQCSDSRSGFWTCNRTNPTFWGCCKQDACAAEGCRGALLTAAYLSDSPGSAEPYLRSNKTWLAEHGGSDGEGTGSSTGSAAYATYTSHGPHGNIGGIVGGVLGGVGLILALILGFLVWRHRRRHQQQHGSVAMSQAPTLRDESSAEMKASTITSTLPSYQNTPRQPPVSPYVPTGMSQASDPRSPVSPYIPQHASMEIRPTPQELDGGQRFHPYKGAHELSGE